MALIGPWTWTSRDASALALITSAAERGHVVEKFYPLEAYRKDQGVPRDDAQATNWLSRAASLGEEASQQELALTYLSPTYCSGNGGA